MKHLFFIMAWLLLIVGCSEQPRGVMSENKMADVMYDLTLANNCLMTKGYLGSNDSVKKKNFEYVLLKHHITPAEFDSSAAWYSRHSVRYEEVYGLVIAKLDHLQKELNAGKFKDKVPVRTKNDTISLWILPTDYHFPPSNKPLVKNQPRDKIYFRFEGSQLGLGDKLFMTFLLKIDPSDRATKQHMWIKVHYFPDQVDSLVSYTKNDGKWRKYTLTFPLSSTKKVKFVEGALLDYDKAKGKQHASVDQIRLVHISYPPPPPKAPQQKNKKKFGHWYWPF
ncbi:MAG: DUF4296 domain-containing protein [Microbacter sp.]